MGEEVDKNTSITEEAKLNWREQKKKIKEEMEKAQTSSQKTAVIKPDKTKGMRATPVKPKAEEELDKARFLQITT